jgi:hypothetical protein
VVVALDAKTKNIVYDIDRKGAREILVLEELISRFGEKAKKKGRQEVNARAQNKWHR